MTALLAALYVAVGTLVLGPSAAPVAANPTRQLQIGASPLPIPGISLPPVLPRHASPSPSPHATAGASGASGHGTQAGTSAGSGGSFGPGGIVSAFSAAPATASTGLGAPPPPYRPVAPPASILSPSTILPQASGDAIQSAVLSLLGGLVLVSLGLWLMAMRHRREALAAATLERTKTDFLNLASHELRGPLTVLKGYVSTAREGHFGALPEALATRMPTLQAQLARMEMLVEQMLETARLETGHSDVPREPADLRRVVHNAVPAERLEGADNRVDIEVPAFPVVVDVDEKRIEQVLRNLVDNALKYSEPPSRVAVRLEADEGLARVSVSDRGFGIAPEDMQRLFSRFGRLVTEKNSHVPGVGLGLYLGRTVARMHGGELEATSEHRRGSTFTLTLPLPGSDAPVVRFEDPPLWRAVRFFSRLLPSRARGSVS